MADNTVSAPLSMNSSLRIFFVVLSLLFNSSLIVYLVLWGSATNSLHQSALAWAFLTSLLLLATFGIGGQLTTVIQVMLKEKLGTPPS